MYECSLDVSDSYFIIGLLNDSTTGVTLSSITSILGYSIIPIVLLSAVSLVIPAQCVVAFHFQA